MHNDICYAVVAEGQEQIFDGQSALDFIATVRFNTGCDCVVVPKSAIVDSFFVLSTGIAGEVMQKFVNYRMKVAIVGDFSQYTSQPLKDLMSECNRGHDIFFVSTEQDAIAKLCQ